MTIDHQKVRRESLRWYLILTLYNAQPTGCYEELLLQTLIALFEDTTQLEVRRVATYLEERELVHLKREPGGRWYAQLSRTGIDLAEYTIDCEPGIARPVKNWG
jgi:hypothetical protein